MACILLWFQSLDYCLTIRGVLWSCCWCWLNTLGLTTGSEGLGIPTSDQGGQQLHPDLTDQHNWMCTGTPLCSYFLILWLCFKCRIMSQQKLDGKQLWSAECERAISQTLRLTKWSFLEMVKWCTDHVWMLLFCMEFRFHLSYHLRAQGVPVLLWCRIANM